MAPGILPRLGTLRGTGYRKHEEPMGMAHPVAADSRFPLFFMGVSATAMGGRTILGHAVDFRTSQLNNPQEG